jgi:hypothetical protein
MNSFLNSQKRYNGTGDGCEWSQYYTLTEPHVFLRLMPVLCLCDMEGNRYKSNTFVYGPGMEVQLKSSLQT